MHLAEYPATIPGVKRGLKDIGYSQRRAAIATGQSTALVSMVLSRKIKSQPCLDKLSTLINLVCAKPEPTGV